MAIEGRSDAKKGGRIRLGMVGGGEGAFIGAVHRIASRIDDHYELVAGALSSTPEKARRSGQALGLAADRIYDDYESMAKAEAKRADGIEAVAIVTPNDVHAGPTYAFLKAGIHVICDKPLTLSLAEAKKMRAAVEKSGLVFALTHNYTGYPLVRRMREMVRAGDLGEIRLVHAEYPQDWLTGATETTGNKQAEWRVDPKRSGAGGALGDIGTHAYNLADYVTGLELTELAADLTSFGAGAGSTTMRRSCCATPMARAARSGRARSRRATRTGSCCASTERRAASTGGRTIRTISSGRRSGNRPASSPAAGRIRGRRRRG